MHNRKKTAASERDVLRGSIESRLSHVSHQYLTSGNYADTAVPCEPVSYFSVVLDVENSEIGIFARFHASLALLKLQSAGGVDGAGGNGLFRRHLHVGAGQRDDESDAGRGRGAGIEIRGQRDRHAGIDEAAGIGKFPVTKKITGSGEQRDYGIALREQRQVFRMDAIHVVERSGPVVQQRGKLGSGELPNMRANSETVTARRGKNLFRLLQGERAALAKDVHKSSQFTAGRQGHDFRSDLFDVLIALAGKFRRHNMGRQQRGNNCPRPARCRFAERGQRLDFVFRGESITGLGFHRGSSLPQHGVESNTGLLRQLRLCSLADAGYARANSAAAGGNLFIARTGNTFGKIHQSRLHKDRMGMRIDPAGNHYFPTAINLPQFALVLFEPGVAQDLRLCSGGNDPTSAAEDSGVLNKADLLQRRPATRTGTTGHGEQLADIGQQKVWRWVRGWQGIFMRLN